MAIHRRNVFYLSGFDPRGVRHYHALYRTQAASYAAQSGESITVSPRHDNQWSVSNATTGTTTHMHFLRWDDLVRRAWIRNPFTLVGQTLRMYAHYARNIRWREVAKLSHAPLITLAYPLLSLLLLPLVIAAPLALLLPAWAALLLALPLAAFAMRYFKSLWLMRFFVFNYQLARERDTQLMQRLDDFADRIVASLADGADETLLVGHSNGSILMLYLIEKIAARLNGPWPQQVRVLTLGHCIPLISYLRTAKGLHAALASTARLPLYWCDIGFPPDGACYALTNPFLPDHTDAAPELHLRSARFFRYYEPARYRALRRNKYQLHFRYLMTGDHRSPFDYTALTTGAASLPQAIEAAA